jgi:hypothetical protein
VLSDGRLRGVLTLDAVGAFVMIEAALRSSAANRCSPANPYADTAILR